MSLATRVASMFLNRLSSRAEQEVEKLLKVFLPGTPFAGKAKIVGGYVRDEYLRLITDDTSIEPEDLDVVVAPTEGYKGKGAEALTKLLHEEFPDRTTTPHNMGEEYPIWQIIFRNGDIKYKEKTYSTDGAKIEFADAMKETYPDPSTRQRKVEPATLEEDIKRRDFTVNMLLKDLTTSEIEDMTGVSKEDIKKGILRGHPLVSWDEMFSNDPLRMIRLIRFHAKYGWKMPASMVKTVKRNADRIKIVSGDRIGRELKKIGDYGEFRKAMKFFDMTGLQKHILPELEALKGVMQEGGYHEEGDVYKHTMKVLENTKPGLENQLAALLHDIGKPSTKSWHNFVQDKATFYDHHLIGAEIADAILKRLQFDNTVRKKVTTLVKNHMLPHRHQGEWTPKALRKFVRTVGEETVDAVLDLAHADSLGRIPSESVIPDLRKKIDEIRKEPKRRESLFRGSEIEKIIGMKGISIGIAKEMLEERLLEKPDLTRLEAKNFLKSRMNRIKAETEKKKIEQEQRKKEYTERAQKRQKQREKIKKKVASKFLRRTI